MEKDERRYVETYARLIPLDILRDKGKDEICKMEIIFDEELEGISRCEWSFNGYNPRVRKGYRKVGVTLTEKDGEINVLVNGEEVYPLTDNELSKDEERSHAVDILHINENTALVTLSNPILGRKTIKVIGFSNLYLKGEYCYKDGILTCWVRELLMDRKFYNKDV